METGRNAGRIPPLSPAPDGTDDRGARPCRWFAAMVQMNCERQVAKKLSRLNIENFVALQRELHLWSDRNKLVDRVVIPMTVFVRVSDAGLADIRRLSFVSRLLTYPGEYRPAPIPDAQMQRFREMLGCTESEVSIGQAPLEVGEQVLIVSGSLRGFRGELAAVREGKSQIIVRLGCLGCARITLPAEYVERIPKQMNAS